MLLYYWNNTLLEWKKEKHMGHILKLFQCKKTKQKSRNFKNKIMYVCVKYAKFSLYQGKKIWNMMKTTIVKKSYMMSFIQSSVGYIIVPGNKSCALHLIGHNKFLRKYTLESVHQVVPVCCIYFRPSVTYISLCDF